MKISSSNINMKSNYSSVQESSKQENLNVWIGERRNRDVLALPNFKDKVSLSEKGRELLRKLKSEKTQKQDEQKIEQKIELSLSEDDKRKIRLLEELLEQFTGKKYEFITVESVELTKISTNDPIFFNQNKLNKVGWGVEYTFSESYYEKQEMSFEANGVIKTQDGRTIELSLALDVSREYSTSTNISFKAGDALIDPLVINFDSPSANLEQKKFSFDLNSEGDDEQISFVASGSGFLAFDKNNDGKINNGNELFGTKTNNGFEELKEYDKDKNSWIDENDDIFDKLRIWTKDEKGNDSLIALGEKGIGAIYLGNVTSAFSLKDEQNNQLGQVRLGGVFLRENGTAGTIQQVDLVI